MSTMEKQAVIHGTFVIERSYPAAPERVFAAFADPAKKRRWFVEDEHHQVEHYELDFRVGGTERSHFRLKEGTPFPGVALLNEERFLSIVLNQRIVTASTMTFGDKLISASLITIEFLGAGKGTDLVLTHQGAFFEGADGPQMREDGWRKLLDKLATECAR
jgi:uncharacterized protein YndB with AHSA1/START domain